MRQAALLNGDIDEDDVMEQQLDSEKYGYCLVIHVVGHLYKIELQSMKIYAPEGLNETNRKIKPQKKKSQR